ncbi:MAG TPA: prolyl oligopeptidase family serine peptidase [Vicinamibacterales bacterium]|nr:prolyl oligopeptidase family serine peptidase [Vicinamibacterales bacterium]
MTTPRAARCLLALAVTFVATGAAAQPSRVDYERALALRERYERLVIGAPGPATWIDDTHRFWYRRSVKDGTEFVVMDAVTREKRAAFDHALLAAELAREISPAASAFRLPFTTFRFVDDERAIEFQVDQRRVRCALDEYRCTRTEPAAAMLEGVLRGVNGPVRGPHQPRQDTPRQSPDQKWEAQIQNYNVAVRRVGDARWTLLSGDGSEGNFYELRSIVWAPDSTKLAAYRVRAGYRRTVHYVETSPEDQMQPRHWTLQYAKPGDQLDLEQPVIFHVDPIERLEITNELFPNPYDLSDLVWRQDSRAVTFEYNQRGHQVYRVIEADATTGRARTVLSEEPKTFFYYNGSNESRSSGKRFRHDLDDGRQLIWMSERDGWNHLYLIDGATGRVVNQITRGEWPVRHVQKVDAAKRQIWFSAGGRTAGEDPYFLHYYRIDFDGSGLTALTTVAADHQLSYSEDMEYFVDTYSRVDLPTVSELRRTGDGSLVAEIERTDITALVSAGWKAPEVFTAKGRDGVTDIWGLIFRPSNFDPARRYPVIENIYAGPHGSHVPKNFAAFFASQAQAELGFIVVQIDGMGTSNRSKAFHDVAWQNLGEAGFADRILWHRAVAARYPAYDISRVGIYGGSAGGQNAMGALLFHGDFYKAAVSYAGCHDNRMDKIWWNEQWMGWPLGAQYSRSSNVDNAARLQGRLLLVVGELDTNVDPASTLQVVSALIKADKEFDLLVVPGENHGAARSGAYAPYGQRKQYDFFVEHLMGVAPPAWNAPLPKPTATQP